MSIFEVLCFVSILVYTVPQIMVFGAVFMVTKTLMPVVISLSMSFAVVFYLVSKSC